MNGAYETYRMPYAVCCLGGGGKKLGLTIEIIQNFSQKLNRKYRLKAIWVAVR